MSLLFVKVGQDTADAKEQDVIGQNWYELLL